MAAISSQLNNAFAPVKRRRRASLQQQPALRLPIELWQLISERAPLTSILKLCATSRELQTICQTPEFWHALTIRDYPDVAIVARHNPIIDWKKVYQGRFQIDHSPRYFASKLVETLNTYSWTNVSLNTTVNLLNRGGNQPGFYGPFWTPWDGVRLHDDIQFELNSTFSVSGRVMVKLTLDRLIYPQTTSLPSFVPAKGYGIVDPQYAVYVFQSQGRPYDTVGLLMVLEHFFKELITGPLKNRPEDLIVRIQGREDVLKRIPPSVDNSDDDEEKDNIDQVVPVWIRTTEIESARWQQRDLTSSIAQKYNMDLQLTASVQSFRAIDFELADEDTDPNTHISLDLNTYEEDYQQQRRQRQSAVPLPSIPLPPVTISSTSKYVCNTTAIKSLKQLGTFGRRNYGCKAKMSMWDPQYLSALEAVVNDPRILRHGYVYITGHRQVSITLPGNSIADIHAGYVY